jgi:hypothetical protein
MVESHHARRDYVSADRLQTKSDEPPYYVAHVRVGAQALEEAGDLRLQAGMPAEVFIRTTDAHGAAVSADAGVGPSAMLDARP